MSFHYVTHTDLQDLLEEHDPEFAGPLRVSQSWRTERSAHSHELRTYGVLVQYADYQQNAILSCFVLAGSAQLVNGQPLPGHEERLEQAKVRASELEARILNYIEGFPGAATATGIIHTDHSIPAGHWSSDPGAAD